MNCIAIVPVGGNWCLARKLHLKGSSFMVEMIIDLKRVENKFLPSSTFDGVECESHKKCFYGARETSGSTLTWKSFRLQVDMSENWVFLSQAFPHTHTHRIIYQRKSLFVLLDCQVDSFTLSHSRIANFWWKDKFSGNLHLYKRKELQGTHIAKCWW